MWNFVECQIIEVGEPAGEGWIQGLHDVLGGGVLIPGLGAEAGL